MKLKFYTLATLLLVCLFAFSSCEKEQLIRNTPSAQPLEGLDYLRAMNTPSILFQFEAVNTFTGDREGWLIDEEGNLRTYENAGGAITSMNTERELNKLLNASAVIEAVDVDALVEHFRNNSSLAALALTNEATSVTSDTEISYYGYHMRYAEQQCSSCNTVGANKETSDAYIERFVLEKTGEQFSYRADERARAAVEWLKALGESMN
ncbi:MAG: hypothetical protein AAF798_07050 [Bacteroidota bacterium]